MHFRLSSDRSYCCVSKRQFPEYSRNTRVHEHRTELCWLPGRQELPYNPTLPNESRSVVVCTTTPRLSTLGTSWVHKRRRESKRLELGMRETLNKTTQREKEYRNGEGENERLKQ
jgi:hypothetical protein